MDDFYLEQTSLRFECLGGIPLVKLPRSPPYPGYIFGNKN